MNDELEKIAQLLVSSAHPPVSCVHGIVDYVNLNDHSANFYAEKDSYMTSYRCYYDIAVNDFHTASDRLNVVDPPYVITIAPDDSPPDSNNVYTGRNIVSG